jgi:hypothetical protein
VAPAASGGGADDLSAAEKAYLESGDEELLANVLEQEEEEVEEQRPERPRTVPHGAFHDERERRKASEAERDQIKAERDQMKERMAVMEDRLQRIIEARAEKPAEKAKEQGIPDPEKDIFGWAKGLQQQVEQLRGGFGQQQQMTEQQRQVAQIQSAYTADANRFRSVKPDFDDAYRHMLNVRRQELTQVFGITNPAQLEAQIEADELQIAAAALQRGVSPAEMVYNLAVARGYQAQAPQQGQARKPANGQPTLRDKQVAARSLGGMGGGSNGAEISSASDLLALNDKDFADWLAKHGDEGYARVMGVH